MLEFLHSVVVADEDDEKSFALLQAYLTSFYDGFAAGHIDRQTATALRDTFLSELQAQKFLDSSLNRTADPLHAEVAWSALTDAIRIVGDATHPTSKMPHKFSDCRDATATYRSHAMVSLAPMKYYLSQIRSGARASHVRNVRAITQASIRRANRTVWKLYTEFLRLALSSRLRSSGTYLKKGPDRPLWLAPLTGRVGMLLHTRSLEFQQKIADELKDILGLWAREAGEPTVVFFMKGSKALFAPNVLTARGYERFRHRPAKYLSLAPNAGLTYNLNPRTVTTIPGSEEVVTKAIRFRDTTEIASIGAPFVAVLGAKEELTSHKAFADHVRDGRDLRKILEDLDGLFR